MMNNEINYWYEILVIIAPVSLDTNWLVRRGNIIEFSTPCFLCVTLDMYVFSANPLSWKNPLSLEKKQVSGFVLFLNK